MNHRRGEDMAHGEEALQGMMPPGIGAHDATGKRRRLRGGARQAAAAAAGEEEASGGGSRGSRPSARIERRRRAHGQPSLYTRLTDGAHLSTHLRPVSAPLP